MTRPDYHFEKHAARRRFRYIAGIDEAGRGPLAGPVVAAACMFDGEVIIEGINDSKKLTADKRLSIYKQLEADERVQFGVGIVEAPEIDQINILQATFKAFINAIAALEVSPEYILVDGPYLPQVEIPGEPLVGGDSQSISIAAASIIAKVIRDQMMMLYHEQWPMYGFDQHKGYATSLHLEAIKKYGPINDFHRMSFASVNNTVKVLS